MTFAEKGRHGVAIRAAKEVRKDAESARRVFSSTSASATQSVATFTVTIFPNRFAKGKRERQMTLEELCDFVQGQKARTKHGLRLIKLASFGEDRMPDTNCLRFDDNVTKLYGIELDYDREKTPFDTFVAKLSEAGVRSLIYSSPSCTPTRPRVRIILPFKTALPRGRFHKRGLLLSRIDGLFGGAVFGPESWKLSQTYYAGRDLSNTDADFRVVMLDGTCIDERNDLRRFEAISIAARQVLEQEVQNKKAKVMRRDGARRRNDGDDDRNGFQQLGDDALFGDADAALASMIPRDVDGFSVHCTQRDVSYMLIKRGVPDEEVIEQILAATMALPKARGWNRENRSKEIKRLVRGAHRRIALEQSKMLTMPVPEQRRVVTLDEFRARQREHIAKAFRR